MLPHTTKNLITILKGHNIILSNLTDYELDGKCFKYLLLNLIVTVT